MSSLGSSLTSTPTAATTASTSGGSLRFTQYRSELELPLINALIETELSEPYIVYTYRYFLTQWPELCLLAWWSPTNGGGESQAGTDAKRGDIAVGVIICKTARHLKGERKIRGYIAMLSVRPDFRGKGIASQLVSKAKVAMAQMGAQEIALETEVDNIASLALYERMGFIKEKRLHRFYLNGE